MKVLLISNLYPDKAHPAYGIFVARFCRELEACGICCTRAVMHCHEGKLLKLAGYGSFYLRAFFMALFSEYDILCLHYASHSSPPVLLAGLFRKLRIITNVHGSDVVPETPIQEKLQGFTRRILKKSEKIIVPSDYFQDLVTEKYGLSRNAVFVYPSAGIDCRVFYPGTPEEKRLAKEKLGLPLDRPVFGMAGRISENKGWDTFLEAGARLLQSGFPGELVMAGSGREEARLEAMLKKRDPEGRIRRMPMLSQDGLREFCLALDFFVFPSRRQGESLGLTALEAMACGVPVLASDMAAQAAYVRDGINGWKFAPGDPEALAAAMEKAILSPSGAEDLSRGAVETALQFQKEAVRPRLREIFSV